MLMVLLRPALGFPEVIDRFVDLLAYRICDSGGLVQVVQAGQQDQYLVAPGASDGVTFA